MSSSSSDTAELLVCTIDLFPDVVSRDYIRRSLVLLGYFLFFDVFLDCFIITVAKRLEEFW